MCSWDFGIHQGWYDRGYDDKGQVVRSITIRVSPCLLTQLVAIDTYGEIGIDGSFTGAEFENGRATRLLVSGPSAVWDISEWTIVSDNLGINLFAPQDYDPFVWAPADDLPSCDALPPSAPLPPTPCPSTLPGDVRGG